MNIDRTLVREMYQSGMNWTEIKEVLVQQNPETATISIAKLREICSGDIKAREKEALTDASAPENYEHISVLGRQVKIRKRAYKDNGIPPEIQDKIQQNQLMASEACATCGFKAGPGRYCTMPCGMCQLGHVAQLGFDPKALIEENQKFKEIYKKQNTNDTTKNNAPGCQSKKNIFDEDIKQETIPSEAVESTSEELRALESDVASADVELDTGNIIDKVLESVGHEVEDVDTIDEDFTIDDSELENAEFNIPKDLDVDSDTTSFKDVDDTAADE